MLPPLPFPSTALRTRLVRVREARECEAWRGSLRHLAKDHRYHEVVADTLGADFDCRCLLVEDAGGEAVAAQPCFLVDQDLALTAPRAARGLLRALRVVAPRLLRLRMLMAGCAAGEGHPATEHLAVLRPALVREARRLRAALAVWKDVPAEYRPAFTDDTRSLRLASMPATRLALDYASFDDYLARRLSHATRKDLRRKFRACPALSFEVTHDLGVVADEVHALYAQVLARSQLHFERLTPAFLRELGSRMPDRARFFLWRKDGRLVAASICLVHEGVLSDEYLGLDYTVAHDWHLYFVTFRDVMTWALAQGLREYRSTPLGYGPKRHLGFELAPLDLHIASPRVGLRGPLRWGLTAFGPTRGEPWLHRFPNAGDL
jgi:hypothetical protein